MDREWNKETSLLYISLSWYDSSSSGNELFGKLDSSQRLYLQQTKHNNFLMQTKLMRVVMHQVSRLLTFETVYLVSRGDHTPLMFLILCYNGVFNGGVFMHLSINFSRPICRCKATSTYFLAPFIFCNYLKRVIFGIIFIL